MSELIDQVAVAAETHALHQPARAALELLARLVSAIELAPTVAVHSIGADGRVRFWNRKCVELFGISVQDAVGQPLVELAAHVNGEDEFRHTLNAIWNTGGAAPARDWHIERRDGQRRWVYSTHFPVLRGGRPDEIFCMEIDVTTRKQEETSMVLATRVFDHCRDAILVADPERCVLAVNPAYAALTGYLPSDVLGQPLPRFTDGSDEHVHEYIWDMVAQHRHWEGELLAQRRDGSSFPVWVALTCIQSPDHQPSNYMLIMADITERKHVEAKTRHLAEHDYLTDLPNRVLFLDRLSQALAAARRKQRKVALMFVDLDRFKGINDSFGHDAGDAVLREVAARLTRCVRSMDTVSRQGGDEFVIILADIGGAEQAAHVAGAIMQAVAQPFMAGNVSISLSVSIGVAISPSDGDDIDSLLKHADVAMYHAKENGRNGLQFFSPEMNAHVIEQGQLEKQLRQALGKGEFELVYQPEIDMASGAVTGVEALLRWRHPSRGLLTPDRFLRAAEDCGLMVDVGDWVLNAACAQARQWHEQGVPVIVSVNLSHMQFLHNNLVGSVEQALQRAQLAPEYLDLEIKEAVITNGNEKTIATLDALRQRGVRLTIDDFGTGISSLSALRRFQLSRLKIDRSFVEELKNTPGQGDIIPAIIALARGLKLRVTAEGVETAEQLALLKQLGCDEYQGHYACTASAALAFTGPRR